MFILYIVYIVILRIRCFYELMLIKYAANIFYIYLGIIIINAIINLILLLVLGIDSTSTFINNSSMEVGGERIIFKLDEGKVNSDLVLQQQQETQENTNPGGGKGYGHVAESNNTYPVVNLGGNQEDKCI